MTKPKADIEAVERAYRAGVLSLREIGAQFGVRESTIRLWAKKNNWKRDLTDQVRERAKAKLSRSEDPAKEDEQVIEEGSEIITRVVKSHRKSIRASRNTFNLLLAELHTETSEKETLQALIKQYVDQEELPPSFEKSIQKAISLPQRAGVMRDLAQALQRLITLERQAYSVDDPQDEGKGSLEEALLAGKKRIQEQYGD